MTTKELENALYNHLWHKGWFGVFECAIPKCLCRKKRRERVDMLTYELNGVWRCIELKVSKTDLHSNNALSFFGNYNYLAIPEELYNDAVEMLPRDIGIYVACKENNELKIELRRNPRKRELLCSHEDMMIAFVQALSREYKKYRKIKEKEDSSSKKSTKKNKKNKTN